MPSVQFGAVDAALHPIHITFTGLARFAKGNRYLPRRSSTVSPSPNRCNYLSHLFGANGYAVARNVAMLPRA
jgi:hypothetical protein